MKRVFLAITIIFQFCPGIFAQNFDLKLIKSPIIFKGDSVTAYRDPAVLFVKDTFYLFFTIFEIEKDGKIYGYTAYSKSGNLINWTKPLKITPKDQNLNYSSPGNVIKVGEEWILCLQTYPRPGYTVDQIPRFGDQTSRIFIMRSTDLEHWSAPELLRVKGPDVPESEMGRMIDPYMIEDQGQKGKYWCFYKQHGVSISWSNDLKNWNYYGNTMAGENVCVLYEDSCYVLFHSPQNGIGIKKSSDLINWRDWGKLITLGQREWSWAQGRITAGTVINLKNYPGIYKYIMFFHGEEPDGLDRNASIGIAWSDDLLNWEWPKKP